MQMTKTPLERKALTKIARKLQAGHAKETTGDVTPWTDLADEDRRLWMRLAKRAMNAILQELDNADDADDADSQHGASAA
jgi:hypothetical protein